MTKARPILGLGEDDPYALAAAKVVSVRTRELADLSANVLDMDDIERVHDMRVASRRLRAALEFFEPCFPARAYKPALTQVKALADALGERRDRDVTIAALSEFSESISRSDRPGVQNLIERIRSEQVRANEALAPFVTERQIAELTARLEELVAEARSQAIPREAEAVAQ